jgi:hypothetical protein
MHHDRRCSRSMQSLNRCRFGFWVIPSSIAAIYRTWVPSILLLVVAGCIVPPEPRDVRLLRSVPPLILSNGYDPDLLHDRYDFDAWLLAQKKLPTHAVVISMSGGSTRAATMAQGVLQLLDHVMVPDLHGSQPRSLADNVIAISGTSGGAITAAAFVLGRVACHDVNTVRCDNASIGLGDHSRFENAILKQNLLTFWLMNGLGDPLHWPDRARPWIDFFLDAYGRKPDGTAFTYNDLGETPKVPFLILNSTDILNDRTFSFVQEEFSDLCADINLLPVAVGVAASGNFPFLSTDIEMRNFRADGPCPFGEADAHSWETKHLYDLMEHPYGYTPRIGSDPTAASNSETAPLDLATWARYRLAMRVVSPGNTEPPHDGSNAALWVDPARRIDWLHLFDGGVADNLGLWPLMRLLNADRLKKMRKLGVEDITFIIVNARWDWTPARNLKSGSPFWTQLSLDIGFDPINRTTALGEGLSVDYLRQKYSDICRPQYGKAPIPPSLCSSTIPKGIYPVILDLDQLVGSPGLVELREEVKNFGDDESLGNPPPNYTAANGSCTTKICVAALAGRTLLMRNPCFRHFLHDTRALLDYRSEDAPLVEATSALPSMDVCSVIDGR